MSINLRNSTPDDPNTLSNAFGHEYKNDYSPHNSKSHFHGSKSEHSRHSSTSPTGRNSVHNHFSTRSNSKIRGNSTTDHDHHDHHHSHFHGRRHSRRHSSADYHHDPQRQSHGHEHHHHHHHDHSHDRHSHHEHHHSHHSNESDIFFMIPRGVLVQYGPYTFHGVCDFRVERLQGLQKVLQKMGAKVKMIPNTDYVNRVHVWYMDAVIFSCKITDFQFGGDGELDPLCVHVARAFDHATRKSIHGLRNRIRLDAHEQFSSAHLDPHLYSTGHSAHKIKDEEHNKNKEVLEKSNTSKIADGDEEDHDEEEEEEEDEDQEDEDEADQEKEDKFQEDLSTFTNFNYDESLDDDDDEMPDNY